MQSPPPTRFPQALTTALITKSYQGMSFIFREDGYFNMTFAAKHFGKQLGNFWMNVSTREYMVELAQALFPETPWKPNEYPNHEHNLTLARNALVASGMGRNGGTFAHPRLAVFFARWLDTKFAVWCDAVIHDILTKKAELTITKPEQSAVLQVGLPDTLMVLTCSSRCRRTSRCSRASDSPTVMGRRTHEAVGLSSPDRLG